MKYLTFVCLFLFLNTNGQNVYKTPSGTRYHLSTCRMVKNVSTEVTVNEAIEMGLSPCKICHPPLISKSILLPENKAKGQSNTVRCKGMTKAGTRCKHMTSISNGYCFQHTPKV